MNIKNLAKFGLVAMLSTTLVACGGGNSSEVENTTQNREISTTTVNTTSTQQVSSSKYENYGIEVHYDLDNLEQSIHHMTPLELHVIDGLNEDDRTVHVFDYTTSFIYSLPIDDTMVDAYINAVETDDTSLSNAMNSIVNSASDITVTLSEQSDINYGFVILNPHNTNRALVVVINGEVYYNIYNSNIK